jgi:sterol desaturase/sphingolipid hydroxylase (fatty acid hydroxylase superfamily)
MNETLWKNDLSFVKDVSMRYVNFFIIVIIYLLRPKQLINKYTHLPRLQRFYCKAEIEN